MTIGFYKDTANEPPFPTKKSNFLRNLSEMAFNG